MKRMIMLFTMVIFTSFALGQVPTLYINEFMASNDFYWADEFGDFDDWIEIYNPGTDSVDIGGMYITDDLASPTIWQIPDTASALTTIPPGGFLILWADKDSEQGVLHVEIKLSGSGEQIGLVSIDTVFVDSLTFGEQTADTSYGRISDGGSNWAFFPDPTANASNTWTPDALAGVVINEFLASNDSCCTDEWGDYDDFIELYNNGTNSINIGGMYVTDELADPASWQIPTSDPGLTMLAPGGFLLLWADKESEQGVLHIEEKLSGGGEQIGLVTIFAGDTSFVDSLTFTEQITDISEGRYPDGSTNWGFMNPTPGAANNEFLSVEDGYVVPETFTLRQNYPNPFNPETNIVFSIPNQSETTLIVTNLLGQTVRTIHSGRLESGTYSLNFDSRDDYGHMLPSGVYFYTVTASSWKATKKMILLW